MVFGFLPEENSFNHFKTSSDVISPKGTVHSLKNRFNIHRYFLSVASALFASFRLSKYSFRILLVSDGMSSWVLCQYCSDLLTLLVPFLPLIHIAPDRYDIPLLTFFYFLNQSMGKRATALDSNNPKVLYSIRIPKLFKLFSIKNLSFIFRQVDFF